MWRIERGKRYKKREHIQTYETKNTSKWTKERERAYTKYKRKKTNKSIRKRERKREWARKREKKIPNIMKKER